MKVLNSSAILTAVLLAVSCDDPPVELNRLVAVEIMFTSESFPFGVGDSIQLRAIVRDQNWNEVRDYEVAWSTSNSGVATVDQTGLVIGKGPGYADIRASAEDVSGLISVLVVGPPVFMSVQPETITVLRGGVARFMAAVQDAYHNIAVVDSFGWISDDTTVATIDAVFLEYDPEAHVRAEETGSAEIVATVDGLADSASITVITVEFTRMSAGTDRACALSSDGHAYCWGLDQRDYVYADQDFPVRIMEDTVFTTLTLGPTHTCGIAVDGTTYCWGSNLNGELGVGSGDWYGPVAGGLRFVSLTLGGSHTCGLTVEGTAYCWGLNRDGQLGAESFDECGYVGKGSSGDLDPCSREPIAVSGELPFASLSAGASHTCGITNDGVAYCWGSNASGELGTGSYSSSPSPATLSGNLDLSLISTGAGYTCGITSVGEAYCWGGNGDGQLGNGSQARSPIPVAVSGGVQFASLTAGNDPDFTHTCGLATDNTVYCWGANTHGQLGDLSTASRFAPVAVAGNMTFRTVESGARFTCGMSVAGLAFCWGDNEMGQLGTHVGDRSLQPARVAGQNDIR
jgi:alpha-tubulin suppressor-like RCC1 family protein